MNWWSASTVHWKSTPSLYWSILCWSSASHPGCAGWRSDCALLRF